MAEHDPTQRMQRPALLGLLHQMLEYDFVTAKVRVPQAARDLGEADRVTAIIAVPRATRTPRHLALGFTVAFLVGFVLAFSLVSV